MKTNVFFIFLMLSNIYLFTSCDKENLDKEELDKVTACFTTELEMVEIWNGVYSFINCSENASTYNWDFGDGTYSEEENPIHTYTNDGEFIVELKASNENSTDSFTDTVLVNWTQVDKPNIYLYPTNNLDICVELEFPKGGYVVKSIPEYKKSWCVNIEPSGLINGKYNYLFYESKQPDVWQYDKGWCIEQASLKTFFENNMKAYNFSSSEIKDFIDHWIPLLKDYDYYAIYPQLKEQIDEVILLKTSTKPDNIFRLFYGVIGLNEYETISEPEIVRFERNGFTVVEWGVFRK